MDPPCWSYGCLHDGCPVSAPIFAANHTNTHMMCDILNGADKEGKFLEDTKKGARAQGTRLTLNVDRIVGAPQGCEAGFAVVPRMLCRRDSFL